MITCGKLYRKMLIFSRRNRAGKETPSFSDVCEFNKFRSLPVYMRLDAKGGVYNSFVPFLRDEVYEPTGVAHIPLCWNMTIFGK